jgi:DNA excision repair protein ERCC-2
VFDEAHNIDDISIEVLTIKMNKGLLENASRNVDSLRKKVDEMNTRDIEKLKDEYNKLVKVL